MTQAVTSAATSALHNAATKIGRSICAHTDAISFGVVDAALLPFLAEAPELSPVAIPLAQKFATAAAADYRRRYC